MRYDFAAVLRDEKNQPVIEGDTQVTMRIALTRALLAEWSESGAALKTEEKAKRYSLFVKLQGADAIDLTTDEASTLKGCIGAYPTLVYGQLAKFLDNGSPAS